MAEIKIDEFLGDEGEHAELEGSEPPLLGGEIDAVDPFAATIAHQAAIYSPEVAREVANFLQVQAQHVEVQSKHVQTQTTLLHDEHHLRLTHLRNQISEETVRRLGIRLRVGFQIFLACVATAIGVFVAFMLHDAVLSRSVVIDAFEIAPNLATQVPSGKIVANGLLDNLSRIQAATRTSALRRSLSNAWTNDIAIEVPETGMSIGQLEQALKVRFGHDQHITGDVTLAENGAFALTVRGTGILAKTFTDESRNLDKLLTQASEYIYGQSQPGLWTNYLTNAGRNDDAIQFAQASYGKVEASERPYVLNSWGNAIAGKGGINGMKDALQLYRETVRLKPDYWGGYNNIIYALWIMGQEEAAVREGELMIKMAGGRPGRAQETMYQNYDQLLWDLNAVRTEAIADMESNDGVGIFASLAGSANLQVAQTETLLHDVESAQLRIKTTPIDQNNAADVAIAALAKALLAEENGELQQAALQWDEFSKEYTHPEVSTSNSFLMCYAAPVYEKVGQSSKADAALTGPLRVVGIDTFTDCLRFKGDVLDLRNDWTGAQAAYAQAIKLAPSVPSGYYSYGLAYLKHGDLPHAAEQLQLANQKGPNWADPLKAWGDVLLKQGKQSEALEKYQEAIKLAPKWTQLRQAHNAIAKAS